MNKSQILILLILIALVVYGESKEQSSKPKPSNPPNRPKVPAINSSFNPNKVIEPQESVVLPPEEIIEKKSSPVRPFEINAPEQEPLNEFVLAPNDYCRQQVLGFCEDWLVSFSNEQQKSKIAEVISLLQAENKPRREYLPAVWSLRAMEGFEFYVGQSFSEWVNLPVEAKPADALTDYGWLTDDNLEFILRNDRRIQEALVKQNQTSCQFHLRTDIANIYNAFSKAKSKQTWDLVEFLQELEWNKAQYVLLPLRVNGNHWGLVVLEDLAWKEAEASYQVWYTSSGGGSLESEKKQIEPFISQVCGEVEVKVIEPVDRESKGYECGVYLVKYVEEMLESGKLELKRNYSEEECQEFRWEWKERIGGKWCCWN